MWQENVVVLCTYLVQPVLQVFVLFDIHFVEIWRCVLMVLITTWSHVCIIVYKNSKVNNLKYQF